MLQEFVFKIQNYPVVVFKAQGLSKGNRDGAFRKMFSNSSQVSLKVNVAKSCGKPRLGMTEFTNLSFP